MPHALCSPDQAARLIAGGRPLLLAGETAILRGLPRGTWIGGSIPYFMAAEGGRTSREQVFVHELPAAVTAASVVVLDRAALPGIYGRIPAGGFGSLIIPGLSAIHSEFALAAPTYPGFASAPLTGWVSGVHLDELGKTAPAVIDGSTGAVYTDQAVALLATLAPGRYADLGIINMFSQGSGPAVTFPTGGWEARTALVDGRPVDFAAWVTDQGLDTRLPLVADYAGAMINCSFQQVDKGAGTVRFYAPVFPGVVYRQAAPVGDYAATFASQATVQVHDLAFSCNCILNYLYSSLEGKRTGAFVGPVTFGEIAYQLLNQTLVHLDIRTV